VDVLFIWMDNFCNNVIAQIVGWENPDPIHKSETTMGVATHCHLR
jgi:hypothetical protein